VFLADRVACFGASRHHQQVIAIVSRITAQTGIRDLGKFTSLRNQLYGCCTMKSASRAAWVSPTPRRQNGTGVMAGRHPETESRALVSRLARRFLARPLLVWYLAATRWGVNRLLLPNPVGRLRHLVDILRRASLRRSQTTLGELAVRSRSR